MLDLIRQFLKQSTYKNLNTVEGSKGLCDGVSVELNKYLKEQGLQTEVIEGIGYIPTLDDSAHEDWQAFKGKDQQFLAHVVVKAGDTVIDLTGAQFNTENGERIVYPFDEFRKEWKKINKPKALNR